MRGKVKDIIKNLSHFDPEEKMFIIFYSESEVVDDLIDKLQDDEELFSEEEKENIVKNPKLFITEDMIETTLDSMSSYISDTNYLSEAWSEILDEVYGSAIQAQQSLEEEQELWELDDSRNEKI